MCLSMKVIGNGNLMFILGIIIGIIGLACMGVNYPIYKKMFKHIFSPAMDMYSISNEEKTYIAAFSLIQPEQKVYLKHLWNMAKLKAGLFR